LEGVIEPAVIAGADKAIVRVKQSKSFFNGEAKAILDNVPSIVHGGGKPLLDGSVNNNVEAKGSKESPLSLASRGSKWGAVESTLSWYNALVLPKVTDETEHVVAHTVLLEEIQWTLSVNRVIGFLEIKEDNKKRLVLDRCQFLWEFGLQDRRASAASANKAMENVVKTYDFLDASINNSLDDLPEGFREANAPGGSATIFGDEDE
jgi:hypothetical protein